MSWTNLQTSVLRYTVLVVSWIAEETVFNLGKQAINWDGTSNKGDIVAMGLYVIAVTAGEQTHSKVVNIWNY